MSLLGTNLHVIVELGNVTSDSSICKGYVDEKVKPSPSPSSWSSMSETKATTSRYWLLNPSSLLNLFLQFPGRLQPKFSN